MILIKLLDTRQDKRGHWRRWAEFNCLFCLQIVERLLSNGLRNKSCGCAIEELLSKFKKGENNPMYGRTGIDCPFYAKKHSIESRQKISKGNKGKFYDEETRLKMSKTKLGIYFGENNPNWQNGLSFEPYSPEFNKELKQQILERDNYKCQDPNCEHKSIKLIIHHIDYDKKNSNPENFITLCNSCHTKTNGKNKRKYYTEFYQNNILNRIIECLL